MLLLSYFLYLLYTVNQFSFTHFRYCVSTFSYKHMPQCKFSLYLKKAGLASRNIVHFLKKVILRCIGLCFNYHHLYLLSRLDQPLIQRIPAGLSSTVACLDITLNSYRRADKLYRGELQWRTRKYSKYFIVTVQPTNTRIFLRGESRVSECFRYPKRKLGITMHFSEIIKASIGTKTPYIAL